MAQLLKPCIRYLDVFAESTGRVVAWLTFFMVAITLVVVILRYGFSTGSIILQESITYLHACVFLLAAAYTLKHDAHVRVDIFYRGFSIRQQAWVNAVGSIVFLLPLCGFILFVSWDFAANAWNIFEGSNNANGIPAVYLLKSLIPLMASFLILQGVSEILKSLLVLTEGGQNND
jgi:TRAP-type mannitol/chloroaromatic compound transport system permease small subunit